MAIHKLVLILSFSALSLCSCNEDVKNNKDSKSDIQEVSINSNTSKKKEKSIELNTPINSINSKPIRLLEYQEDMEWRYFDTLIDNQYRIRIEPLTLKSFVTQEWDNGDSIYRVNYYDFAYNLVIENNAQVIIDTLFSKDSFITNLGQDFYNISNFHGYWLDNYNSSNNTATIFGNICKPDTDWCLFFNHKINLKTVDFEFIIPNDDE